MVHLYVYNGILLSHKNEINKEAWRAAIHGVAKSRTRLSDWADLIWSIQNKKLKQNYSREGGIEGTAVGWVLIGEDRVGLTGNIAPEEIYHLICNSHALKKKKQLKSELLCIIPPWLETFHMTMPEKTASASFLELNLPHH